MERLPWRVWRTRCFRIWGCPNSSSVHSPTSPEYWWPRRIEPWNEKKLSKYTYRDWTNIAWCYIFVCLWHIRTKNVEHFKRRQKWPQNIHLALSTNIEAKFPIHLFDALKSSFHNTKLGKNMLYSQLPDKAIWYNQLPYYKCWVKTLLCPIWTRKYMYLYLKS